ncbi:MAG: DNA mismatch repair protein MutS [Clostridia bacterium]|nr:DNA mismatch repair protein MutS [Clostridia bacterium]
MALSPMMAHYLQIKEQYPDCVVFYRLGDFYEMFFEDAERVSKILDLTLTGRDCGDKQRAPMCGVPYHAADAYIAKLVEHGEKVAICEQLELPVKGKKLVDRDVVRVISAGTLTEESLIDSNSNNYILSAFYDGEKCGFSWCDITTGQFYTRKCVKTDLIAELCDHVVRIAPAEIIANAKLANLAKDFSIVKHNVVPAFTPYGERDFEVKVAENLLKEQFKVKSLEAYGISDSAELISSSGGLIAYLRETQKHALVNVNGISIENPSDFMMLDSVALRNLELVKNMRDGKRYGTLLWLLDKTSTAMGARTLSSWISTPLTDVDKINYRLDGVDELYKNALIRGGISDHLKSIKDIERLSGKISNGNVTPKDCFNLGVSLSATPNIKMLLLGAGCKILNDVNDNIYDFSDIVKLLEQAIVNDAPTTTKDGGYIRKGFDSELDRLRTITQRADTLILDIQAREREATGIKNLKVSYNKVFGYYIEVTNSFKDLVPYHYVRKQTLTGAERYITDELKTLEEEILTSSEKAKQIELAIFNKIKQVLIDNIKSLQRTSRAIACLDVLTSFATVAKKNNYVRPEITSNDEKQTMNIVGGRHPVVEAVSSDPFIANDTYLDTEENRMMIITGPNMAGKSTYMRQNALIAIMAHIGSFVPAKSAQIPIIDRIFTRVGASDNLIFDQSTFMVEMTEVASIILNATKNSLLILDEVGRGTSTFDGLSIAWAVVEYLTNVVKAKTLFATHYHELSELEGSIEGVNNYKITVKDIGGHIAFLRKIMKGSANRSFGIEVASLAGVPSNITQRAKQILKKLEKNDVTKTMIDQESFAFEQDENLSEVEEILLDTDINSITPMQALSLLADLKNKVNK